MNGLIHELDHAAMAVYQPIDGVSLEFSVVSQSELIERWNR